MSSASVAFGAVDPMRLFIVAKWRSIRTVKHSVWPASASLIKVLSSNIAIDGVMGSLSSLIAEDAKDQSIV
jgi:hypothetical protein